MRIARTAVPRFWNPSLIAPTAETTPGVSDASASTLRPLTGNCCASRASIVLLSCASVVSMTGGVACTTTLDEAVPTLSVRFACTWAAASTMRFWMVAEEKPANDAVTVYCPPGQAGMYRSRSGWSTAVCVSPVVCQVMVTLALRQRGARRVADGAQNIAHVLLRPRRGTVSRNSMTGRSHLSFVIEQFIALFGPRIQRRQL